MDSFLRLTQLFTPEHYDISLNFHRTERTFDGVVSVTGTLNDADVPIRLNAKQLDVQGVLVDGKTAQYKLDQERDILEISHPDLKPGKHVATISYVGRISASLNGVYPSTFKVDGHEKELIATQFESHYARKAFPCIDEPEAKATFDVTLKTERGVTVLGNMPIKWQREEDDALVTTFERTPRMSVYLLAWVYGELHKKTATTTKGTEVSIWATPAQPAENLDFALSIATRVIDFFEDYFGVPYPLPKSDHVALPDFSSGAMENWGLVTYRETSLLTNPTTSRLAAKQYVANVIAHELSHQWFGNLVTMKWWNDLWLNESFASIMEFVAIDALEPEWNCWLDFATTDLISAMQRDAIDGVQPIQADVRHPDEINTIFDPSIVYAKGARLIRMLQAYIGEPALRKGLRSYFQKHAYQNSEANDLWDSLSEASGLDVGTFMNAWMTQSGYPVVSVEKHGDLVTLSQEQFFIGPHKESTAVWPIPLHASGKNAPTVLDTKSATFNISPTESLHLNADATSHFITRYDEASFNMLIAQLSQLSIIERVTILFEQILLVRAGLQPATSLIPLLSHFKQETNEAVWDSVTIAINELRRYIESDEVAEEHLKHLIRDTVEPNYARLGWEAASDETENDTKLRSTIISFALYAEHPDATRKAEKLFSSVAHKNLPPELRAVVLAHAVRTEMTPTIVDDLLEIYQSTADVDLREDINAALTATRNIEVVRKLAALLKDSKVIRHQNFTHWFVMLLRNRYGRTYMWEWARTEWSWIEATFADDSYYDMLPRYIASSLVSRTQFEEYRSFYEPLKKQPALVRNITVGCTELGGKVAIIEANEQPVCQALRKLY